MWPVMALAMCARPTRQPSAAGGRDVVGDAADVEAEQVSLFGKGGKDRADGVVGCHLFQLQLHRGYAFLVDLRAVAGGGHVGAGLGEAGQKRGLERSGLLAEEPLRELQHARGIGDDLHGFDAGDVVKEPAATGVHELGVTLHLHELKRADLFGLRSVWL